VRARPCSTLNTSGSTCANWPSNRVFDTYDEILDATCDAWRKLIAQPEAITSIGLRDWVHLGQK
jgi:hypothetical protein